MVLAIVFLVSTVSLGSLTMWESPAQAAPPEKEKVVKLRIDGIRWENGSQRFVVDLSCERGIANAMSKGGNFMVSTELEVGMGGEDARPTGSRNLTKKERATPDEYGMVQLEPQYIPWDRHSGTFFDDDAYVTTTVVVKNRIGHILWGPVSRFDTIYIPAP